MRKEVKNWLEQAKDDLEKAKILFDNMKYDGTVFFCQQGIEKSLKALLIKKKQKVPRIHDLVALSRIANCPNEITDKCRSINPYYTETRYQDFLHVIPAKAFNKNEVSEIIQLAEEVIQWIKRNLH